MIPTITSGGTPNCSDARCSVAWFARQNFTPASMRTGSMKARLIRAPVFTGGEGDGRTSFTAVAE